MKSVCFVDDDKDEIRHFRQFMGDRYIVGTGTTLDDALQDLKNRKVRKPDLFMLDLYYGPDTPEEMRKDIAAADEKLSDAEAALRALLVKAGQSPNGGFTLAAEVQARYPRIPRVVFSRKAFLKDALRAHEVGLPLLEKPDPDATDKGTTSERYDAAFRRHSNQIFEFVDGIINRNRWLVRNRPRIEGFIMGFFFFVLKIVWDFFQGSAGSQLQAGAVGVLVGVLGCSLGCIWLAKR